MDDLVEQLRKQRIQMSATHPHFDLDVMTKAADRITALEELKSIDIEFIDKQMKLEARLEAVEGLPIHYGTLTRHDQQAVVQSSSGWINKNQLEAAIKGEGDG